MKAKQRTLVVLLALLAAACGAFALLYFRNAKAADDDGAQEAIALGDYAAADIRSICYTFAGETISLTQQDDTWILSDDPEYHVDQTAVQSMVTALSPMQALRRLENTGDPAQYGLASPEQTVTVQTENGETTFSFGSSNSVTGAVYLQMSGDDAVYTVSSAKKSCFACGKAGLYSTSYTPVTIARSEITRIRYAFQSDTERFQVSLEAVSEPVESDGADSSGDTAQEYETVWYLENESATAIQSYVTEMLSQITAATSAQETQPGGLAVYGLDQPALTVQLTGSGGEEQTFYLGIGSDGYYLMEQGGTSVYTVSGEVLDAFCVTAGELRTPTRTEEAGFDSDAAFSTALDSAG